MRGLSYFNGQFKHFVFASVLLLLGCNNYREIPKLEIPKSSETKIIYHKGYCLNFNEQHKQANWVAYQLTKEETNGTVKRTNRFLIDTLVNSACNADYKKSGYDRGHLIPAADLAWSAKSMKESFYYSNMSPQAPSFNRGVWKRLESKVRSFAVRFNEIYVVTGPVFQDRLPTIGANKVSVPKLYYKVIIAYSDSLAMGIGFVLPNKKSNKKLSFYAVPIDSVEILTGIDFFYKLPNKTEQRMESEIDLLKWNIR